VTGAQGEDQLTWLGHSTVLLELAGGRVITDPLLTHRVAHLRRHVPIDLSATDRLDAVLVSHVHHDHLHVPSLRALRRDVAVVVPVGAGRLVARRGFDDVREVQIGDVVQLAEIEVEVVPARHGHRRGPHSRVTAAAVGYVVRTAERSVYFAGDTDLFPEMAALAPVDVALLPIWGWGPSIGEGHLDPQRAVEAALRVGARLVVPIHWGTYSPAIVRRRRPAWLGDPAERFCTALERIDRRQLAHVLEPGERLVLAPRAVGP
jgi:L-ascorbate metabolism protein UlaG (beta-lactamase superfamily)